jgi:hypothetical protein
VGTGYTFFPENLGEFLAYYLHAKTIFPKQFFGFQFSGFLSVIFFWWRFFFEGPIKLMPGYELLDGGWGVKREVLGVFFFCCGVPFLLKVLV